MTTEVEGQTHILRAFITLMNNDSRSLEACKALDVLAEAARDGQIQGAVKTIALLN